jgi:glycosyltransferase involved in cell wall biosynthesis
MIKDGETGLTFEPGNVADLKEKIRYMLEHSGDMEKMGRTARLFVEKERNSESYYNALMAIYTRCINEK